MVTGLRNWRSIVMSVVVSVMCINCGGKVFKENLRRDSKFVDDVVGNVFLKLFKVVAGVCVFVGICAFFGDE